MQLIYKICIVFTTCTLAIGVGAMHWQHAYIFEKPTNFEAIKRVLNLSKNSWSMIHVMAARCSCSHYLAKHLIERAALTENNVKEIVIMIDGKEPVLSELKNKGFQVFNLSTEEVKNQNLDIKGLPLLIINDAQNNVRYAGGYDNEKLSPFSKYADIEIFNDLKKGIVAKELPIKGCTVAKEYQAILDPIGIKYTQQ